jgi:DNA-directed RNA polymerase specialized sigma24 family protein
VVLRRRPPQPLQPSPRRQPTGTAHRTDHHPPAPDDGGDPQQRIERLDPTLDAAIRSLTLAEQEIIHLWAWEHLEPREIAIVLDQTPNAVSVALSRSRRKLADRLTVTQMPRQDPAGAGQVRDGDTMELGEEA